MIYIILYSVKLSLYFALDVVLQSGQNYYTDCGMS